MPQYLNALVLIDRFAPKKTATALTRLFLQLAKHYAASVNFGKRNEGESKAKHWGADVINVKRGRTRVTTDFSSATKMLTWSHHVGVIAAQSIEETSRDTKMTH